MTFTLGAAAEIKVSDPRLLDIPLLHRIPSAAVIQRLLLYHAIDGRGWRLA